MNRQNKTIIKPLPTTELLLEKETKWRVSLPEDYKDFIRQNNGLIPEQNLFLLNGREVMIERFLAILKLTGQSIDEVYDIAVIRTQLDERIVFDEDVVGVELLPIAVLFAGDFLCLDFSQDREFPSICLWYHDMSGEFDPCTEKVADSFSELLEILY